MSRDHFPDPVDRASAEADLHDATSIEYARKAIAAHAAKYPPQEDGECACGCGSEVHPARLKLGLGLAIECAERLERKGYL